MELRYSLLWSIHFICVISRDITIHLRSRLPRYRHGNIIDTIEIGYSCSLNRTISEKTQPSLISLQLDRACVNNEEQFGWKKNNEYAYMARVIRAWLYNAEIRKICLRRMLKWITCEQWCSSYFKSKLFSELIIFFKTYYRFFHA